LMTACNESTPGGSSLSGRKKNLCCQFQFDGGWSFLS
jgi:hypothetical protein